MESIVDRVSLCGDRVVLCAVEPADVDFMYGVENDIENWGVSGTTLPFSRYMIQRFVESQSEDIHTTRQLRLVIKSHSGERIGLLDLFDFDSFNHRAGVGVFIAAPYRGLGYACDSFVLLHRYCRATLQLHQLWCSVEQSNEDSLRLFRGLGYREIGRREDWIWRNGGYSSEVLFQKIL